MSQPSTRALDALPPIGELIRLTKAVAMLEAIVSPDWEYRYYSFDSTWGAGEMMASMRNGSGDEYFILFDKHGAAIKGFDHESEMTSWRSKPPTPWPGIYEELPAAFSSFRNEPAFGISNVTFCIWRRHTDSSWQRGTIDFPSGEDPDGSAWLLAILDGKPSSYQEFARDYYEAELPLEAVEHIYRHLPLTDDIVKRLNNELTLAALATDMEQIGYPDGAV
jgi:hypothetical protein